LDSLSGGSSSSSSSSSGSIRSFSTTAPTTTSSSSDDTNFQYVPILSIEHADLIANKVIECCRRNQFNPITVYVLDSGGNPIIMKRMDGVPSVGISDFALAKAYSCIVNKYPSRTFRDRYTSEESSSKFCQLLGMVAITNGQMAPFPGGILLKYNEHLVGAVGVSGAAGDEDEYCAIRGVIESGISGLSTIPEKHSCSTVKD
jgi:uncharacterized protein GlcG (DUF336 family)